MSSVKDLTQQFNNCEIKPKGRLSPNNKMISKGGLVQIKHPDGHIEWYNNGVFVPNGRRLYADLYS